MGIDSQTDLGELSARVRAQVEEQTEEDADAVTCRSFKAIDPDALRRLSETFEAKVDDDERSVLVISRANAELLFETEDVDGVDDVEAELGHETRVADRMPDDALLLLNSTAVDGERVVDPAGVVYGQVGLAAQGGDG
ncbi:hypothetical protein OB905_09300 [Halobacteria archaeon AArc-dxtr1]|nr:hypothetical protein [Halobacteria archaeon AArc-dxtr1]